MKIGIIGTGYVGLVSGACFASKGHSVTCVDIIQEKVDMINQAIPPIYEKGLEEMLQDVVAKGLLKATLNLKETVKSVDIIYICVGTPSLPDGSMDYKYVEESAKGIGEVLKEIQEYKVVVVKSTCVPGTTEKLVGKTIETLSGRKVGEGFGLGMNPEFLREGLAVEDFLHPDRVVIGASDEKTKEIIGACYEGFDAPILYVSPSAAEMIKYASNSFLAMKISFINEMANLCDIFGLDIQDVAKGVGMDHRISDKFLRAGAGFGGSCLPPTSIVMIKDERNQIYPIELDKLYLQFRTNKISALTYDCDAEKMTFKNITNVTRRNFTGKMYKIKTAMNKEILTTNDHPFLVYDEGTLKTVLAEELAIGMNLPSYSNIPNDELLDSYEFDMISEIVRSNMFNLSIVKVRPKNASFRQIEQSLEGVFDSSRLRDILASNCMKLNEYLSVEDKIKKFISRDELLLFTAKGNTTYTPAIIKFTEEFCRLLGYYASEGCITYDKSERGRRTRIMFSFNINETEYIEDMKNILNSLSIRFMIKESSKNNSCSIVISSKILGFLITDLLLCGKDSYTKNVPRIIYSLKPKLKKEFLKGSFRGDGHIQFPKQTNSVVYDYGSISEMLVKSQMLLYSSLGIIPSYKKSISKKSSDYAHFYRISTKKQVQMLKDFKVKEMQEKVDQTLQNCKDIKPVGFTIVNDNLVYTSIKSIEHYDYQDEFVFSIEVEDTENFVTDFGFVIHNCFPKDVRALLHKSQEVNLPSILLQSTLDVNAKQPLRTIEFLKQELSTTDLSDKTISILGLAFKPDTDDMREAPSLIIIKNLLESGAKVHVTDPIALNNAKKELEHPNLVYFDNVEETLKDTDACILVTEWNVYKDIQAEDFIKLLKHPILIDGRRLYDYKEFRKKGIRYRGIGLGI